MTRKNTNPRTSAPADSPAAVGADLTSWLADEGLDAPGEGELAPADQDVAPEHVEPILIARW